MDLCTVGMVPTFRKVPTKIWPIFPKELRVLIH